VENIEDLPLYEVDYNYFHAGNRLAKRTFDWLAAALLSIISAPLILTLVALRRYKLHKVQFLGVDGSHFNGYVLQRRNGQNNSRHFISNLPLLWSILDGKLSFVGSELKTVDRDGRLLRCKPGLTGLYHIQNHHPLDDNDYQNFEHYYLQNHTFFLDIEIILKTILNI
jgi:lipopolysaccharide/colanic/teichoic acid biosynthesis glycosyltransferase